MIALNQLYGNNNAVQKKSKSEGGPFGLRKKFRKKFSQCQKKTERGDLCCLNIKKLKGDYLAEKNLKKSLTMPKKEKKTKRDPLVSPGIVCHAEKEKNLFGSVP